MIYRRDKVKKGIIGGTFDPFHNGHLHIAYEAFDKLNLDKIVFIPTGNPPHKDYKNVTDALVRYNMVKKAIANEKNFEINDYEVLKDGFSYTYETLKHLRKIEPDTEWYFICGVDCLIDLDKWINVACILDLCRFVVFLRPGYSEEKVCKQKDAIENKYNKKIYLINLPQMDISSSYIRERIKNKKNVSYLIPCSVEEDINILNLYR
ncbi:nicotinate-nucleotide adenylyltransferase [Clostridium acidisoli]|uniref:nicotinate-nucleotide adenylyltransferase n=1 Tax=Clostridium acidisoli TaxID=91624 RepID=UPI0009FD913A|nr:nicotinate-nucleotide adenylyltransferase [Clostridium acidisoli]